MFSMEVGINGLKLVTPRKRNKNQRSTRNDPAFFCLFPSVIIDSKITLPCGLVGEIAPRGCTRDEGRSFGTGLQEQASNPLKLLWSRARVVSVKEKARRRLCQVRFKETSASEPLMRCRKSKDDVKTGGFLYPRISSGGSLLTARAASGIEVA